MSLRTGASYEIQLTGTSEILASLRILEVITPRWNMAKNCHDVLSWLLESIRRPAGVQRHPISTAEDCERPGSSHAQTTSRGEKRPRDDQPLHSCAGPERRRVRLSTQNSPRSQWATLANEDPTQPSQSSTAGCENSGASYQSMASAINMDPQCISTSQYSDLNSRLPASFMYQDSMPASSPRTGPPFIAIRNDEWDDVSWTVPNINPPPSYDVFDGAMWGSLLEMVDLNG